MGDDVATSNATNARSARRLLWASPVAIVASFATIISTAIAGGYFLSNNAMGRELERMQVAIDRDRVSRERQMDALDALVDRRISESERVMLSALTLLTERLDSHRSIPVHAGAITRRELDLYFLNIADDIADLQKIVESMRRQD